MTSQPSIFVRMDEHVDMTSILDGMHPYARDLWVGAAEISLDGAMHHWGDVLPLLFDLKETPQEPIWHAEGDVAIHTQMVIDEMLALLASPEFSALTERQRFIFKMSALLHDIAKPLVTTTRETRGALRIVAPRHAQRGAAWLAYRVVSLGIPLDIAHEILALVYYHHDPKFLIIKERPAGAFRALSRKASALGLYLLEQADMRGRRCEDRDANIELIDMYRLFTEDAGVWCQWAPYRQFVQGVMTGLNTQTLDVFEERAIMEGIWDWDLGTIYTHEEAVARSYASRERFCCVVLTCGPSGSGKSSWVKAQYPDYVYIGMDDIRLELTGSSEDQSQNGQVFKLAREKYKEALRNERDVIWDATSLRRDQRDAVLQTGRDYGAHTTLAVFQPSLDVFTQRNRARDRQVPEAVLDRQVKSLEWPERDEAHRVLWIDGQGRICRDTRRWIQARMMPDE